MRTIEIDAIPRPIARLGMGMSSRPSYEAAAPLLDVYAARGGTLFDTAHQYGPADRILGQWLRDRGLTDAVTVIGKGCHTPDTHPEHVAPQLAESLERLQRGCIDLYFLHRDDEAIPVGEWVDALDPHVRAGRIRRCGGSNWTTARIDAANAYAARTGKTGFTLLSNQFSLADMIEPPWAGCRSASDDASQAWLRRTGTPLVAWSSQARGFLTERGMAADPPDPEVVRCWHSPTNLARRARAAELAARKGTTLAGLALAYTLAQDFTVLPIIGPMNMVELESSLGVLDVALSPGEVAWLRNG